jgi:hypothetical protein
LIAKCVYSSNLIPGAEGKLRLRLVVGTQVGILYAMLCFQANPLDIVLRCHRMFYSTYGYMNRVPIQTENRNMLFFGSFRSAGDQLFHFLSAAVNGNTIIPKHGYNVATMIADQKLLLHIISLLLKSSDIYMK